ncbi:hypothetical protein [Nocardia vinacea]|uniref:hypothetical protein n=1 Tax=Nocardia vinacea TaxID=96468 RepID=UPI0012F6AF5F|nr:hypothetical protein [Nocardia vinacea]
MTGEEPARESAANDVPSTPEVARRRPNLPPVGKWTTKHSRKNSNNANEEQPETDIN